MSSLTITLRHYKTEDIQIDLHALRERTYAALRNVLVHQRKITFDLPIPADHRVLSDFVFLVQDANTFRNMTIEDESGSFDQAIAEGNRIMFELKMVSVRVLHMGQDLKLNVHKKASFHLIKHLFNRAMPHVQMQESQKFSYAGEALNNESSLDSIQVQRQRLGDVGSVTLLNGYKLIRIQDILCSLSHDVVIADFFTGLDILKAYATKSQRHVYSDSILAVDEDYTQIVFLDQSCVNSGLQHLQDLYFKNPEFSVVVLEEQAGKEFRCISF